MAPLETAAAVDDSATGDTFTLIKQQIELDFSFAPRQVKGRTTLDIQPDQAKLREVVLNCRQLKPTSIKVEGERAAFSYSNLHERLTLNPALGMEQYHFAKERIARHVVDKDDELVIYMPEKVKVRTVKPAEGGMADDAQGYATLKLEIEYELDDFRDALHFVGVEDGDARFPHAYTRNSPFAGTASCLFPCIDDGETRALFEVSIRYPRTLGDALSKPPLQGTNATTTANGVEKADSVMLDADDDGRDLSEEEKAMEMSVICSGTLTDDISDVADSTRKTASFSCDTPILPQHIGFVIGPFEHVDLSEYRDIADDERLGENAIKVHAFCLPGKEDEVRNSAMMLARALDAFTERFQSYAFGNSYKLAFVDDLICDTTHSASFSICSSRLLFPETVWEPLEHTTRVLVHAVASQWIGVDVVAHNPEDYWIIVGGSWFMAELYLRELFGRNDWRFRQKIMVDKVVKMDNKRPSLQQLGEFLQLDPGQQEFMELKSLMVLSILHNRLLKQSGKNGVDRCLYRMLFNARQGKYSNGAIATDDFFEICEKVGHQKLESFWNQWVMSSGCPEFECTPNFNKKKQVVSMIIRQTQGGDAGVARESTTLSSEDFMREAKERNHNFRPTSDKPVFVGPMTIRIHEADGTPYEHIVDINSNNVKVEIPYNTKYKRLKRNRLNKERIAAAAGLDAAGEAQEDVTFYMLGDLFATPEEQAEWRLTDWSPEDETKMEQEAYEWIRVDADFEWIASVRIADMPSYMYVSQLQQDKDVVAQAESIQYLGGKEGHRLISTFLIKTLMDSRYFHGIRTMAAEVMAQSAKKNTGWIGLFHLKKAFQELYCLPNSPMTRANDFSDRSSYLIQCAIPKAIAKIKDENNGKAPMEAKRFLLDLVRYNNNRGNDYSDDHYISTLMRCLADCLASPTTSFMDVDQTAIENEWDFSEKALGELTRHQRLDEWIPTYQNIYTTTALDCTMKLIFNHVTPFRPTEFLQYSQLGNADNVRLKAWDCLIRLGTIQKDTVLRFLIHEITTDPSPYFRNQLLQIFGVAVGQIATGTVYSPEKLAETSANSLVLENDNNNQERVNLLSRKNLHGALKGLKNDVQGNLTLRVAMEDALRSKTLSISDMSELLDFCDMVYDEQQQNKMPVVLRYPRYWKVEHLGKGKLVFTKTRIRTQALRPLPKAPAQPAREAPAPRQQPPPPPPPAPLPKLSLKIGAGRPKPTATSPLPPAESTSAKPNVQPSVFVPNLQRSPSPITAVSKSAPVAPPEDVKTETRESTPDIPLMPAAARAKKSATPAPVVPAPIPQPVVASPAPVVPAAAPAARNRPTPVNVPSIATPPAIASPIPLPAPKLKIRTKTTGGPATSSSRPASAAPSPRPSVPPPSSRPTPTASSAAPRQPKSKKSRIVKLALAPAILSRFPSDASKKRKLQVRDDERPFKRPSLEPSGVVNGGLVSVERHGGDRRRLVVKIRVGVGRVPVE
ncbi:hypothetical protein IQ07DRAFT_522503 [Pyrenochaeta sp. DS3sAY3a]|nr:hypothetical protein IQ07DRAFT_522503 [Pyrenochaeta sp. DS3sAY3a]